MGNILRTPNLSQTKDFEELKKYSSIVVSDLLDEMNGRLQFVSNIMAAGPYGVTFSGSTDVEQVPHSLGKVPTGFLEINRSAAISIYSPSGISYAWTNTVAYLQASGAGNVLLYFI